MDNTELIEESMRNINDYIYHIEELERNMICLDSEAEYMDDEEYHDKMDIVNNYINNFQNLINIEKNNISLYDE